VTTLDTLYQVETPEGIDLQADLAGPVPRALAYSIDIGLRLLVMLALGLVVWAIPGHTGTGVLLLISFLLEWFYPVLFEVYRDGQTPGKKWLGLAVVNDDLTPVSWSTSLVRNLLRAVDFLPFGYMGGLFSMIFSRHFQRLGDLAAGTLVIHRPRAHSAAPLSDSKPQPPPVALALSMDDQIALIDFAQRHKELSAARQRELANLLEDLTRTRDDAAVQQLRGVGAWLLGAR
jgi:uncharacterized RDD family membrane protein YckC